MPGLPLPVTHYVSWTGRSTIHDRASNYIIGDKAQYIYQQTRFGKIKLVTVDLAKDVICTDGEAERCYDTSYASFAMNFCVSAKKNDHDSIDVSAKIEYGGGLGSIDYYIDADSKILC